MTCKNTLDCELFNTKIQNHPLVKEIKENYSDSFPDHELLVKISQEAIQDHERYFSILRQMGECNPLSRKQITMWNKAWKQIKEIDIDYLYEKYNIQFERD